MLYPKTTAEDVKAFVREARRIERAMGKETSQIPSAFALAKLREVAVAMFIRETGELTIEIPPLPRPTLAQLRAQGIMRIERDTSPTGPVKLMLTSVLRADEAYADGPTYDARLAPHLGITLGLQHADWVVENQGQFPELAALCGKVWIDFPGLVVVDECSGRGIPCLDVRGERWKRRWNWLYSSVNQRDRVAVSGL